MRPHPQSATIAQISAKVQHCSDCPRLRSYCQSVAINKRRSFQTESYWGAPVSGFGDPNARLVIVGLAPAAHGANRTGRIFTGDRSGDWLYRALYDFGFANQPQSVNAQDGLQLRDCYVTCAVKCAPPDNKPTREEFSRCSQYLNAELAALKSAQIFLALGSLAYDQLWESLAQKGKAQQKPKFRHGLLVPLDDRPNSIILSYHPSQQNTFTGRLTREMFDSVFVQTKKLLGESGLPDQKVAPSEKNRSASPAR